MIGFTLYSERSQIMVQTSAKLILYNTYIEKLCTRWKSSFCLNKFCDFVVFEFETNSKNKGNKNNV